MSRDTAGPILISACLAGRNCKYNGGNNLVPEMRQLLEEGRAVPVCPEELGGLPTPRDPSERLGERVVTRTGKDVTEQFVKGAEEALRICREAGCTLAVLKARSPSCGKGRIYNGRFEGALTEGSGVFAGMVEKEGIPVMTEDEFLCTLRP